MLWGLSRLAALQPHLCIHDRQALPALAEAQATAPTPLRGSRVGVGPWGGQITHLQGLGAGRREDGQPRLLKERKLQSGAPVLDETNC